VRVILDSTPLGLLCDGPRKPNAVRCRQWRDALILAGHTLVIPEIIDYETRRELVRVNRVTSVGRLDKLRRRFIYLGLTGPVMDRAAALWADARQTGRQTAGNDDLDIDMILIAQAESLLDPTAVIATSNVAHLASFFNAELWWNIRP
jgi:hypothetical protein